MWSQPGHPTADAAAKGGVNRGALYNRRAVAENAKSSADKRLWPRVSLEARVAISYPTLEELVSGPLVNLSEGGAYIRTTAPKPEGTRLWLRVSVSEGELNFETRGEVARIVSSQEARETGLTPGMGIRFLDLEPETQASIRRIVEAALALQSKRS